MPEKVIQHAHKITHMEGHPNLCNLMFATNSGEIIDINDLGHPLNNSQMVGVDECDQWATIFFGLYKSY
jgi:hypothetical protein